MNYRHLFHAGNFADVFKHIVLIDILRAMMRKESPLCYLETHAGAGEYDVGRLSSQKIKEYESGIGQLLKNEDDDLDKTSVIHQYIEIIKSSGFPEFYPGSPLIMKHCLRPQDRMILAELHPEEYQSLKELFKIVGSRGSDSMCSDIGVHHQDGYEAFKAFLPPKERRGLVFIDPPYEKKDDWQQMIESLKLGMKRFSQGIYVIWYPIKDLKMVSEFKILLKSALPQSEILITELSIFPNDVNFGLIGSGLAIINPPWLLDKSIKEYLPVLWRCLSPQKQGGYTINYLK